MGKHSSMCRLLWSLCSVLLAACLCASWAVAASEEPTVVGILKSRSHMIDLLNGTDAPLYTVKNAAGEVLAEALTEYDLLVQFPHLEGLLRGVADDASLHPMPVRSLSPLEHRDL